MGRRPKDEISTLAQTAREQLKRARALGKSLDVRLKKKQDASDEFTLDEDYRRDFAAVTAALQHAGNALTRAVEAQQKTNAGLTEVQLEAQFAAEIVKMAPKLTETQWASMCDAREKARHVR